MNPDTPISLQEIIASDRSCTEFYTQHFSKIFSKKISACFIEKGISANQVTLLMLVTGVIGSLLIASSRTIFDLIGCFFILSINILDTCDGEIARATNTCSRWGVFLDKLSHIITNSLLFFCVGYHYYSISNCLALLILGFIVSTLVTVDDTAKEIFLNTKDKDTADRKLAKLSLSFDKSSLLQSIVHITTSTVAFYHIFPLAYISDLLLTAFYFSESDYSPNLSLLYFYYFAFFALVRVAIRIKRISSTI